MGKYSGVTILAIIVLITAVMVGWAFGSSDCAGIGAKMNTETYYSFVSGCQYRGADGNLYPLQRR